MKISALLRCWMPLLVLFLSSASSARELLTRLLYADAAVVGEVVAIEDAGKGWQILGGKEVEIDVSRVQLSVKTTLKGSLRETIALVVPAKSIGIEVYDIKVGSKGIWYLRAKSDSGWFKHGAQRLDDSITWRFAGIGEFAPADPFTIGSQSYIQLATTSVKVRAEDDAALKLCKLMLANALMKDDRQYYYLSQLADLNPNYQKERGEIDALAAPGEDQAGLQAWFSKSFISEYKPANLVEELNALAVRMHWGEKLDSQFLGKLDLAGWDNLHVMFPQLQKWADILHVAERAPSFVARDFFIGNRRYKEQKLDILRVAKKRLGEDRNLDAGILEAISALYDRPDLSPFKDGKYKDDFAAEIERLRALIERELGKG